MENDLPELLSGVIVAISDHKTGIKGPVEVRLNPTDLSE